MNLDEEMTLDSAQETEVERAEDTAEGGEASAQDEEQPATEQDSTGGQDGSDGEFEADNDDASDEGGASDDSEESDDSDVLDDDDYDGFYHDMSEIEQDLSSAQYSEEDEGGDTTTDPEGEDGDDGENEDEDTEDQAAEGASGEDADEGAPGAAAEGQDGAADGVTDYASWEAEDRAAILKAHPELEGMLRGKHLSEVLDDPGLFGYMRGTPEARAKYSAVDAFEKASAKLLANRAAKARAKQDSKQHLKSSNGKAATTSGNVPPEVMRQARELFPGKTRAEIEKLYKNVT